jgi:hypothetical protein
MSGRDHDQEAATGTGTADRQERGETADDRDKPQR